MIEIPLIPECDSRKILRDVRQRGDTTIVVFSFDFQSSPHRTAELNSHLEQFRAQGKVAPKSIVITQSNETTATIIGKIKITQEAIDTFPIRLAAHLSYHKMYDLENELRSARQECVNGTGAYIARAIYRLNSVTSTNLA